MITIKNWPYRSSQMDANFPFIMGLHPISSWDVKQDEQRAQMTPEQQKKMDNWLNAKQNVASGTLTEDEEE